MALAWQMLRQDNAPPAIDPEFSGKTAIWEARLPGQNGRAILFGTVHALPGDLVWLDARIEGLLVASDQLVLEVPNLDDPDALSASFARLSGAQNSVPLLARVPAALHDETRALVKSTGVPISHYAGLDSWAVALTLSSQVSAGTDTDSMAGADKVLLRLARRKGLAISGLESADRQFLAFENLPEADQRALLALVVREADSAAPRFAEMVGAWAKGDMSAIETLTNSDLLAQPAVRAGLLTDRNRAWAVRIRSMLARGESPFVAVGTGHLVGDDSVQAMLMTAGVEVKRLR